MQNILNDSGVLFFDIFDNIAVVTLIIAFARWFYKLIKGRVDSSVTLPLSHTSQTNDEQSKQIDAILVSIENINNKLSSIEEYATSSHAETNKNIMRIQILDGIARHEFSESQVKEKYDEYHKFGGNSDVTDRVKDYIELLKKEKHEAIK